MLRCAAPFMEALSLPHKGHERDGAAFVFAVLFNDHVYRKPELRKLLEVCVYGQFTARYLRRCEQLHKRWPNFDPRPMADWLAIEGATETEQSSMSKLAAWASANDRKMADRCIFAKTSG